MQDNFNDTISYNDAPEGGEAEETPEKPEDTAPEAAEISEKPETPEKSAEPKRRKNGVKHIMDAAAEKLDVFFEKVNDLVDRVCAAKATASTALTLPTGNTLWRSSAARRRGCMICAASSRSSLARRRWCRSCWPTPDGLRGASRCSPRR